MDECNANGSENSSSDVDDLHLFLQKKKFAYYVSLLEVKKKLKTHSLSNDDEQNASNVPAVNPKVERNKLSLKTQPRKHG